MTIGKKFNELTTEEYIFYINNYKKYDDFNTLGLYRSLLENEKLLTDDKIRIREHAHAFFKKTFDFLQLKDPKVFVDVSYLGINLTKGDEEGIWNNVIKNQQTILKDKRLRHRNFGVYSKHNCPYQDCIYQGLMVRPNSFLAERNMHFAGDKFKYQQKAKSLRRKSERKNEKMIINEQMLSER